MSSGAEAELAGIFVTAKEMVPLSQTLITMRCPQPPSPIQTNNSTPKGVINKTTILKRQN